MPIVYIVANYLNFFVYSEKKVNSNVDLFIYSKKFHQIVYLIAFSLMLVVMLFRSFIYFTRIIKELNFPITLSAISKNKIIDKENQEQRFLESYFSLEINNEN